MDDDSEIVQQGHTFNPSLVLEAVADHRPWPKRLAQWLAGSRPHRVVCVLVGLWLFNAFDVTLTVMAYRQGLLEESNPIAARLLSHSPYAVTVFKLAMLAFATTVLFIHRDRRDAEIAATGTLIVYVIVALQWQHAYELYAFIYTGAEQLGWHNAVSYGHLSSQFTPF